MVCLSLSWHARLTTNPLHIRYLQDTVLLLLQDALLALLSVTADTGVDIYLPGTCRALVART